MSVPAERLGYQQQLARRRERLQAPTKPGKVIKPTKRIETGLYRNLKNTLDDMRDIVLEAYEASPTASDFNEFLSRFDEVYDTQLAPMVEQGSEAFVDELDDWHAQQFYQSLTRSVGVSVRPFVNEQGLDDYLKILAKATAEKATDAVFQGQLNRLQEVVSNALMASQGKSTRLRTALSDTFGVSARDAARIARDQTQRMVNGLNQFRQEAAGIEEYIWVTSKDNRVRDTHAILDGLTINWATGKIKPTPEAKRRGVANKTVQTVAEGHVGSGYNCRCVARPLLRLEA